MTFGMTDMYGYTGSKADTPSTSEMVSAEGPIQSSATPSWLALVVLFFVFRVVYEMAQ